MICDFITRNKIFTRDDPLPREKKNKLQTMKYTDIHGGEG